MRRLSPPVLALLAACAHVAPSPTRTLDDAAARAADPAAPARTVALAGFQAFLVENRPDKAASLDAEALRRDPGEPYALALRMALERRDAHPEASLDAALRLVRSAPRHPLAAVAAREIQDMAGVAVSLDQKLRQQIPRAPAAGAPGDTAALLRATMAQLQSTRDMPELEATRVATGIPGEVTILGPLAPLHVLGFDTTTGPEKTGEIPAIIEGPLGPVSARVISLPDGRISLESEGLAGDVYVAGIDLEVTAPAVYAVRSSSASTHRILLDGTTLLERRTHERPMPLL